MNVSCVTLVPNQYYYIAQYNTYALYNGIYVAQNNQLWHVFTNIYGGILTLPLVNVQYAYY
jgi:hypothetical protein